MRIESAHIRNFKLLGDVDLHFSTDRGRPLTVIRAENGSGKTSILYALRWGMYGKDGVPAGMRLTSTSAARGRAVTVQVRLEFAATDPTTDEEVRYRLIRTCDETPGDGDAVNRSGEKLRLLRRTTRGEEDVREGAEALITTLLPKNLANVFFTNGDDVQRFIAGGRESEKERQREVHEAIRQVLGLDDVVAAEGHLSAIAKQMRADLSASGGAELQSAQEELDRTQEEQDRATEELSRVRGRIEEVEEWLRADEHELDSLRGLGDLDVIQARIHELEADVEDLERREIALRSRVKEELQSESLSWTLLGDKLRHGLSLLERLADNKVIPGPSVEVLNDRLALGVCICGEPLQPGDRHYDHVRELVSQQDEVAPELQRLTALLHQARNSVRSEEAAMERRRSFTDHAKELQQQYIEIRDARRAKTLSLNLEREKRGQINQDRVQELTTRLQRNRRKRSEFDRQYGEFEGKLQGLEEELRQRKERLRSALAAADLNKAREGRYRVANDLVELAKGTLATLHGLYVQRTSSRMDQLFLEIVGADPTVDGSLFNGVHINAKYDIIVQTRNGRTLDADTELNGASQRALTLAFIWALMEVAEKEAPRIIDTPLGMTSGAVKRRMVEMLTRASETGGVRYQVVLFMTRSEIRDIEGLIDKSAGSVFTLTCSKDYPVDLVNDLGSDVPTIQVCPCSHTEVCGVCERRRDMGSGRFTRREERGE